MMIEIVFGSLFLLAVLIYYFFIVEPKKLMAFYQKVFQGTNFKVHQYPFTPFQASEFLSFQNDQKKYNNCYKTLKQVNSQFDVIISNVGNKVLLGLVSPQLAQAYHQVDQENYYRKFEMIVGGLRRMVGNGITLSSGQQWKTKRRITTKMLNFTYIKSLVPKIEVITKQSIEQAIKKEEPNEKGFRKIDILELTTKIASTVILQLFFAGGDTKVDDLRIKGQTFNHHLRKLLLLIEEQLLNPLAVIFGEKYTRLGLNKLDREVNQLLKDFHEFTRGYVTKRLEELQEQYQNKENYPEIFNDLIEAFYVEQILKQAKEVTPEFVQSLVDDFATLYTAGSDTTSHNSHMSIYYLYSHPSIQKELEAELRKQIPSSQLTFQSFRNCTFLEATLTETLRVYSSANGIFHRQAKEDHFLNVHGQKILIKKGTLIMTQTIPIHYKASVYPNPFIFDPHRFIGKEGNFVQPEPFTWMNFSAGVRNCIGKQLAWIEMKVILSTLVRGYDIEVVEDEETKMIFKQFAANIEGVSFQVRPKEKHD